jgi:hypothetical protein
MKTIHKSNDEIEWVNSFGIGSNLIYQCGETSDVTSYYRGLFDVVEFAKKDLMLIPIKAFTNHVTKLFPCNKLKLGLDGLVPTGRGTLKMHLGHADPHRTLSAIHPKVLLATMEMTT